MAVPQGGEAALAAFVDDPDAATKAAAAQCDACRRVEAPRCCPALRHRPWSFRWPCFALRPDGVHIAHMCRAAASAARPLLRCAKCKVLWYCSKECQVPRRPLPRSCSPAAGPAVPCVTARRSVGAPRAPRPASRAHGARGQVAAWPAHKKVCKKLREALEGSQEDATLDAVMARMREDMKALVAKKGDGVAPAERERAPQAAGTGASAEVAAAARVVTLDGAPVSDAALPGVNGQHSATFDNGDRYEGNFSRGEKHGRGTYTWLDGQTYVGEYVDGKQHGLGKYRNEGGDEFEGSWVHGKRHGRGVSVFASGSRFEGDFQDDKQHGQGTYTWADGDKYEGEWDGSDMHGTGKFSFASGKVFEGTLFRDRPVQGTHTHIHTHTGVLTDADGLRYRVTYKKGAAELDGAIYDDPPTLTKTLIDA